MDLLVCLLQLGIRGVWLDTKHIVQLGFENHDCGVVVLLSGLCLCSASSFLYSAVVQTSDFGMSKPLDEYAHYRFKSRGSSTGNSDPEM